MNQTTEIPFEDPYPFEDFAPTLAQCFLIVIAGYTTAKFELFSASDLRGVNAFAAYFAMPGIICISLADANFSDFRWELLISLFLGKAIIFIFVANISFLLSENVGIAGMLAIFCVHSNDLPVGNPLMSALYGEVRPHMLKYLFLIPAMTVLFFIPVSNFMIKFKTSQNSGSASSVEDKKSQSQKSWIKFLFTRECMQIGYDAVLNPVIFSTSLGLILNFAFKAKIPGILHKPIKVLAATIPGLALSILGFSMVRKERYLISSSIIPAMVLLVVKMIFTPLVLHTVTRILSEQSKPFKLLSDFALLYGIVSPATAVFQSGQEFRNPLAAMSATLIMSSFASFPVSYVVARFTIVPAHKLSSYIPVLKNILIWVAGLSIFCDIFTLLSIIKKRQFFKFPCCYVAYFVLTQVILCCGIILWHMNIKESWSYYTQMALYYGGEISGYIWIGTIAVILILNSKYPALADNGYSVLSFTVFSVSAMVTTVMCLLMSYNHVQVVYVVGRASSNFEFLQLISSSILLLLCVSIVGTCLILQFKRRKLKSYGNCDKGHDNALFFIEVEKESAEWESRKRLSVTSIKYKFSEKEEAEFYYEDIVQSGCCVKILSSGEEWSFRIFSLLLMLWLVMVIKLTSNLFKITKSEALEIMVPLEFLQSSIFTGQGLFILLTFGIDTRSITVSCGKWLRKLRNGKEEFVQPSDTSEKGEFGIFCTQFYKYFFKCCFNSLAKERKWKNNTYKNSFWGHQLADWLIEERLVKDNSEAEEYGQKLLLGGLISHVKASHNFYDAPYLYYFVKNPFETEA